MKIVPQEVTLNVENHDFDSFDSKDKQKHGPLFPSTIRGIIVGPSNCGKTNLMITLLEHPNGLKFENIYVYSKSLYQPKYIYLKKLLKPIKGISFNSYCSNENIIPPNEAKRNSIFIFDDVSCDKQNIIKEYFSMGRHNHIDCFYLSQTYAHIPKHLIRDNCNFISIFRQDDLNLKHVFTDHVTSDMTFENFKDMCSLCWSSSPHGFITICKDSLLNNGRYRKTIDHFILI